MAFFDCLHDMGDPVCAEKHVKQTLGRDGAWMIVEPFAHDNLKDNLNPVGRVYVYLYPRLALARSLARPWRAGW